MELSLRARVLAQPQITHRRYSMRSLRLKTNGSEKGFLVQLSYVDSSNCPSSNCFLV